MNSIPLMLGGCVCASTLGLQELLDQFLQQNIIRNRSDRDNIKLVFRLLLEFCPAANTENFDKRVLWLFQSHLVALGYERKHINKLIGFIKRLVKYAEENDIISEQRAWSLCKVSRVKRGQAKENKPRMNVPEETVMAILPYLPPMIADMVQLQMLTGMRPSEVCAMTTADIIIDTKSILIDYDPRYWLYSPAAHKTAHHGIAKQILLGSEEQATLKKYLNAAEPALPLFRNRNGNAVSELDYGRKIKKTIEAHNLPKFTPYQIRHMVGTDVSKKHGQDTARALLGHSSVAVTRIYDHSDMDKQKRIIESRPRRCGMMSGGYLPVEAIPVLRVYRGEGG